MKYNWSTREQRRFRERELGKQYDHWFPKLFDPLTKVQAEAQIKRINTELDAIYTRDEKERIPDPYAKHVLKSLAKGAINQGLIKIRNGKIVWDEDPEQLGII